MENDQVENDQDVYNLFRLGDTGKSRLQKFATVFLFLISLSMCSRRKILPNTRKTEEKVNQGKERKKKKERKKYHCKRGCICVLNNKNPTLPEFSSLPPTSK